MASVEDSKELKVTVFLQITSSIAVDVPGLVFSVSEFFSSAPVDSVGPGFTTSPVADKVLVTAVDENLNISGIIEDGGNLRTKVSHPVTKEVSVNNLVAFFPFTTFNTKHSLNSSIVKQIISLTEIVAKRRRVTAFSDVINVKSRIKRVTNNGFSKKLAEFKRNNFSLGLKNKFLADLVSTLKDFVPVVTDETILMGEISVSRVLHERINKTVSNSQTLKVELQTFLLIKDIVTDSGNVMAGITLTSNVKISTIERGILLKETIEEINHVSSNFILVSDLMTSLRVGVTSTNRLVNVEQVSLLVPRVLVRLERRIISGISAKFKRSILVESSNLRSATWTTSKPDNKRISLWV